MSEENEIIKYRANLKEQLKKQFLRSAYDPRRYVSGEEQVFDPAIQRFMSMKATQYDHFKANPKTALTGIMLLIPFFIMGYLMKTDRDFWEHKYSTGQISYADRERKFV